MGFEKIFGMYADELNEVEEYLLEFADGIGEKNSRELVRYFLEKKGHRLRPVLSFLAYEGAGGTFKHKSGNADKYANENADKNADKNVDNIYRLAASVELLHSASLLHDDVIDLEPMRRGQKTVNELKGNKIAILVGNIFYLNAFKLIVDPNNMSYYEAMLATSMDMCQGEIFQSEKYREIISTEEYLDIIGKKTARLIELSCFFGATSAGADETTVKQISRLGYILGIFYQIRDDKKDRDVTVGNSEEVELACNKLHDEFMEIVSVLDKNQKNQMKNFVTMESTVRP